MRYLSVATHLEKLIFLRLFQYPNETSYRKKHKACMLCRITTEAEPSDVLQEMFSRSILHELLV